MVDALAGVLEPGAEGMQLRGHNLQASQFAFACCFRLNWFCCTSHVLDAERQQHVEEWDKNGATSHARRIAQRRNLHRARPACEVTHVQGWAAGGTGSTTHHARPAAENKQGA